MTNFIVPIDFSEDSLKGLEWAILFSQKKRLNIQMVYVISNSSNFQSSVVELEQKYAEAHFKKLVKKFAPGLGNESKLGYVVAQGKVYEEIVKQANSLEDVFISASTHGASGFEELFVGSNALKIIAATELPVFTVRKTIPDQVKKIIVPITLHPDTRQKTSYAADLAGLFDAELHVLSISTRNNKKDLATLESYSNQVVNYFRTRKLQVVAKTLVGESLPNLTCNYTEAVDADLIIIMSSAIDKWNVFLGSFAQQMLHAATLPLLSITPKE